MSPKVKKEQAEAIVADFKKLGVRTTFEQDLDEKNEVIHQILLVAVDDNAKILSQAAR